MRHDLDELLSSAAPPLAPRTPEFRQALDDLVAVTEAHGSPRRRRRHKRIGIALAAAAALLGAGVTAQAAGILLPQYPDGGWERHPVAVPLDLTLPSGETCQVVYMVSPAESETYRHSQEEWDVTWAATIDYLATVDPDSLVSSEIQRKYRKSVMRTLSRLERTLPPDEMPPPPSDIDVIMKAPGAELMSRLRTELKRQGLPTDMMLMGAGNTCDPESLE